MTEYKQQQQQQQQQQISHGAAATTLLNNSITIVGYTESIKTKQLPEQN